MKLSNSAKILIAVIVLALIGGGAYYFYSSDTVPIPLEASGANGTGSVGQDILDLVSRLDAVKIDPSLFSAPLFANLKDIEVPITPEVAGRGNPFDPIGVETGTVPTQTVTKTVAP